MIIEISKVSAHGSVFEGEEDAALLDLTAADLYAPQGPIRYRLEARMVGRRLVVRGMVEVRLGATCRRCGCTFSTFSRESQFLYQYETREGQRDVDVTPDLREALLLRLEPHPLCAPGCAGLCPRCGHNLNEGPCTCGPGDAPAGRPWAALDEWSREEPSDPPPSARR